MPRKPSEPIAARGAAYVALYPMLLQIAKDHGYTLCVHGSLHRDFDLVAVPWIDAAEDPAKLIVAIKEAVGAVVHNEEFDKSHPDLMPTDKPHGRVAYALHVTNAGLYGGYLDISVMRPIRVSPPEPTEAPLPPTPTPPPNAIT